ncbi:MAG TPA: hypothetical protein VG364_03965 [Candidatus Dormibacteraeota bacterium]|jgi:hypothetical protein|nr:hypothetical protein [Candidatus Dormibacteraeota bacterium]
MLDAIVALVVVLLVVTGVFVILGPRNVWRRVSSLRRPGTPVLNEPRRPREGGALNPKTQRVVVAAGRLANWMRSHGHDDVARDIRGAAARLNGNEAAGLYALQTTLRRIRVVNITDVAAQERLRALIADLRTAVDDRFEQLELLPFKRP